MRSATHFPASASRSSAEAEALPRVYLHDNGGKYPYLRTLPDGNNYSYGTENDRWWWARLLPFYPLKWTNATYQCPGYKGAMTGLGDHHDPLGS